MRFAEQAVWLEFVKSYTGTDEGEYILKIAKDWAEGIEDLVDRNLTLNDKKVSFREAVDSAFLQAIELEPRTDTSLPLKASADLIIEALFILTQVWEFSEEMISVLTPIEQNFLTTVFAHKIQQLNDDAEAFR